MNKSEFCDSLISDKEGRILGLITIGFLRELALKPGGFHANSFMIGSRPGDRVDVIGLLLSSGLAVARPIGEIDPDNDKQAYLINLDETPISRIQTCKTERDSILDGWRRVIHQKYGEDFSDPDWIVEGSSDSEAEYAFGCELLTVLEDGIGLHRDVPLREQLNLNIDI